MATASKRSRPPNPLPDERLGTPSADSLAWMGTRGVRSTFMKETISTPLLSMPRVAMELCFSPAFVSAALRAALRHLSDLRDIVTESLQLA